MADARRNGRDHSRSPHAPRTTYAEATRRRQDRSNREEDVIDFSKVQNPHEVPRLQPDERVERNLRELPDVRVDELLTLRNGIQSTPLASQERSVARAINVQAGNCADIFHSVSGIRVEHVQSLQKLFKINENGTTLLELSAASKPSLDLIPVESHDVEGETFYVIEALGALEDPFISPEIIRTKNRHRLGVAAHTSWSSDLRHRSHQNFPKSAPRINTYYEQQEANAFAAEEEDKSKKISSDLRITNNACQPTMPRFLSFSFPLIARPTTEKRRRLCRSAATVIEGIKAACATLFDASDPARHFTNGSLEFEEEMNTEDADGDSEDPTERSNDRTIKSGVIPGLAFSSAFYTGMNLPLQDDSEELPILAQSIRAKAVTAVPSRDLEKLNFVTVKHAHLDGSKPSTKNQGAIHVTLVELPVQTILAGLLNLCRCGGLSLEYLHFINNLKKRTRTNVVYDGREFAKKRPDDFLQEDSDDSEPSL